MVISGYSKLAEFAKMSDESQLNTPNNYGSFNLNHAKLNPCSPSWPVWSRHESCCAIEIFVLIHTADPNEHNIIYDK